MDNKELRSQSVEQLKDEEKRLRKELFETYFRHGTRQLTDTAAIRRGKRDIARVLTILREKQAEAAAS